MYFGKVPFIRELQKDLMMEITMVITKQTAIQKNSTTEILKNSKKVIMKWKEILMHSMTAITN